MTDLEYVEQYLFLPSGKEREEAFRGGERLRPILPGGHSFLLKFR